MKHVIHSHFRSKNKCFTYLMKLVDIFFELKICPNAYFVAASISHEKGSILAPFIERHFTLVWILCLSTLWKIPSSGKTIQKNQKIYSLENLFVYFLCSTNSLNTNYVISKSIKIYELQTNIFSASLHNFFLSHYFRNVCRLLTSTTYTNL